MARFTKALRQQIVREFAARHCGVYDPEAFLAEVRRKGASHPAFEWFEWDHDRAAFQYQIEQARAFARDLTVSFKIETVGRDKAILVRTCDAPFAVSPISGRRNGGGYFITDPNNPEHIREIFLQAARDLEAWMQRYRGVLSRTDVSMAEFENQLSLLEGLGTEAESAAA